MSTELPAARAEQRERARVLGIEQVAPSVTERDRSGAWDPALFSALGAAGLLGAPLPREHGGGGLGAQSAAALQEGFGEGSGDAGLALAWGVHTFQCGAPLAALGTPEQQRRYLPALAAGTLVAAFAGPELRAADALPPLRARRHDHGWVLAGNKGWVVNAPVGELFVVLAVTDPDRGWRGVSAFLIERGTAGLRTDEPIATTGLRSAPLGALELDGCVAAEHALLGGEGGGAAVLANARQWARCCLFAHWLGILKALLDQTIRDAREQPRLGRPAARSQSVRATLADLKIRYEIARRLTYGACAQLDQGRSRAAHDAAVAALHLAECVPQCVREALELQGTLRVTPEVLPAQRIERAYRDAAMLPLIGEDRSILGSVVASALLGG